MFYAGVDIGSLGAKAVVISESGMAGHALMPTGVFPEKSGQEVLERALADAHTARESIRYSVATGYGRITAKYASKTITEITCHARGAHYLHPATRTIVDIGGQDCKVIRLDDDGNVADFAMNDKCAAGTGRFLEVIANVFKVPLNELGEMAKGDAPLVPINNTCTVFAETEIISLVARGERAESILKGVFTAIASRVAGIASRIGVSGDVFFSGGVAKNYGVVSALESVLNCPVFVPDFDPQLVGALGAAVLARELGAKA
jgi:predicted CoA-substrate-specific enzyme activase